MSVISTNINNNPEKNHKRQFGWIEKTLNSISHTIEQSVFTEEHARQAGWLQSIDPRAKLVMFLVTVLAASLSSSLVILLTFYLILLCLAYWSKIPFDFFVRRVWLGIPFFAGIVILPAVFFTGEPRLFDIPLGNWHLGPSWTSLWTGAVFIMRVAVSVSLAVLLIVTTPWSDILKSLQAFRVPQVFILLLSMTYRYIFLFLHSANGLFEARKSRTVGYSTGHDQRRWVGASMGSLMNRSFKMSNDVYSAMMARGFQGSIHSYSHYRMTRKDWLTMSGACILAVLIFLIGRYI